eukprot:733378-Amphidinium_carterae.1
MAIMTIAVVVPLLTLSLTTALAALLPSVAATAPAVSVAEWCSAMASTMLKLRLSSLSKLLRLASSTSISTRSPCLGSPVFSGNPILFKCSLRSDPLHPFVSKSAEFTLLGILLMMAFPRATTCCTQSSLHSKCL